MGLTTISVLCAPTPLTPVVLADTVDRLGPLGAESMSESPDDPVAPELANTAQDATGVRMHPLPMRRDRVWEAVQENDGR